MNNDERLAWHRPEVKKFTITVDTRLLPGSGEDGGFVERFES